MIWTRRGKTYKSGDGRQIGGANASAVHGDAGLQSKDVCLDVATQYLVGARWQRYSS